MFSIYALVGVLIFSLAMIIDGRRRESIEWMVHNTSPVIGIFALAIAALLWPVVIASWILDFLRIK